MMAKIVLFTEQEITEHVKNVEKLMDALREAMEVACEGINMWWDALVDSLQAAGIVWCDKCQMLVYAEDGCPHAIIMNEEISDVD